ncbi:MAG: peptidase E [Chryseolinea sp.]
MEGIHGNKSVKSDAGQSSMAKERVIFAAGSGINSKVYIRYIAKMTGKVNPKICHVPTATGDNPNTILNWYANCEDLEVRPYVMRTFINSLYTPQSFEEQLLSMDAVIVGGGNTLNMIAIWRAHGIDLALRKAYDAGIVMAGGSAGSLCWFNEGSTDSRPKELTVVQGLGFLDFSHSPHYLRESGRRPLYQQLIKNKTIGPGYACDDEAAMIFVNGRLRNAISLNAENHCYYVSLDGEKISEQRIEAEIVS